VEALNGLGLVCDRQGRLDEAEHYLKQAIAINPNYAFAHNNLGVVYEKMGKKNEAIECYRRALRIDPNYADARNNLQRFTRQSTP
jgi:tetratricopeptide (TPR) repeat protein